MATGLRRDDRRALAGTGSPGQDRGRLRSTANFGRKCSRISPFDQDDDARPRCPWIIDNRHATLQIPHAYLPDSMQGSGRRVIASDAATVSFPDSLPVKGRWLARPVAPFVPVGTVCAGIRPCGIRLRCGAGGPSSDMMEGSLPGSLNRTTDRRFRLFPTHVSQPPRHELRIRIDLSRKPLLSDPPAHR